MKTLLSSDEHELVVELMNIGIGRAANALSQMVQDEVLLSVPDLQFLHPTEASGSFCHYMPGALAGVMQDFSGFMSGRAALLFPEERSLELVRAILGEDMSVGEISELEQETLSELGNILLNNCLATLANLLNQQVQTEIPQVFNIETPNLLSQLTLDGEQDSASVIMLVQIKFSLRERDLEGYLAFVIDVHSADKFIAALQQYLSELIE
ncbi:chemotaxis protein CheC [Oceanisphaera pacifica]|uniref:Chemotaxis protein CheC n=1 Tax=Oceanisphaera pacifica TaxID=2818389 RepID=A0ABS3NG04_9GAMM|nr:chemotaxis protein CheC [Oceanisphaera pacifica]MBO1519501.1 chemotaxis protein CheC [Oceanisphaera pacifica]